MNYAHILKKDTEKYCIYLEQLVEVADDEIPKSLYNVRIEAKPELTVVKNHGFQNLREAFQFIKDETGEGIIEADLLPKHLRIAHILKGSSL